MNAKLYIRRVAALTALLLALGLGIESADAERIKDIATVGGVRTNQLVGYGLVVGLDGTGDQTATAPFTIQSIANMLAKCMGTSRSTLAPLGMRPLLGTLSEIREPSLPATPKPLTMMLP